MADASGQMGPGMQDNTAKASDTEKGTTYSPMEQCTLVISTITQCMVMVFSLRLTQINIEVASSTI